MEGRGNRRQTKLQWVEFSARASTLAYSRSSPNGSSAATGDRAAKPMAKDGFCPPTARSGGGVAPGAGAQGGSAAPPDNDLQIDSKFISRHHCQLVTGSDGITVVEDLNSTNGIVVRGKRVRRFTLRDGDVVTLGQHEILYIDDQAQHLADTHDDLPRVEVDAANEDADADADEDAPPEGAAGAR